LPHPSIEVDVGKYAIEAGVLLLEGCKRLVQSVTDVVMELVADVAPSRRWRDEKGVGVEAAM
jgi:hypothetical protein